MGLEIFRIIEPEDRAPQATINEHGIVPYLFGGHVSQGWSNSPIRRFLCGNDTFPSKIFAQYPAARSQETPWDVTIEPLPTQAVSGKLFLRRRTQAPTR